MRSILASVLMAWVAVGTAVELYGQCGSWTGPTNLSYDYGRYAVDGSLAVDSSGNVHLVYQSFHDYDGFNYYINNVGGSWSSKLNLGTMGGKGSAPRIVITPDDQLHVFYGKGSLYWRTKPVSGGSWSTPQEVALSPDGGFIQGVTVDSTGGIYFLYGHLFDSSAPARNGIYGRYKPLGGAWQGTELIYGNSQDGNWPDGVQIIANGTTLWVTIQVDGNMYFKKKPATGVWPGGRGTQFYEDGGGLRLAFDPTSNEIAALWAISLDCDDPCEDDPWYEAYVKYSYDDGATWTGKFNLSDMTLDLDRTPSGKYDANGNLHVLYEGFCCDHRARMRYRARIGGVWAPIQQLSGLVGGYVSQAIATYGTNVYTTFSNTGTGAGLYDVMFMSQIATLTRINIAPGAWSRTVWAGDPLSNDTFTVANGCVGTLNYNIAPSQPWMQVSPATGSSSGERDTIIASYPDVPNLLAGTHTNYVTVTGNSPDSGSNAVVTVHVQTVKPDQDGDGDCDQVDFGLLQSCLTGEFIPQTDPECQLAMLDGDTDVDEDDVAVFLNCVSGPDVPVVRTCAEVR